jgi:hypothetical protein
VIRRRTHPRRAARQHGAYVAGGHPLPAPADVAAVAAQVAADVPPAPALADRARLLEDLASRMRTDWPVDATMLYPAVRTLPPVPPRQVPLTPTLAQAVAAAQAGQPAVRALDWSSRHDPRSKSFDVAGRLRARVPVQDFLWRTGPIFDQGVEGACVGMAVAAAGNVLELEACRDPHDIRRDGDGVLLTVADARRLYARAQTLDDVPGADYSGTSVLAGMLAGREAGLWDEFLWAFGTRDIAQSLLQVGPVVIGIPWLEGMYSPGRGGVLRVQGAEVGGHAMALVGMRLSRAGQPGPFFAAQQSWGDVGDEGIVYLHHKDLARLLAGRGEAAIPVPVTA